MPDLFLARLRALTPLRDGDLAALAALMADRRAMAAERHLVAEGDRPEALHVMVEGWAARVKHQPDGRRHLAALLLPGDLCDVDGLHVRRYDYGVVTLTPCRMATIERKALLALCEARPAVARALTWLGFVDNALLNEAAASLARRVARARIAHLLCELKLRLGLIGQAERTGFHLPLTQEKIADALGLTPVHVNRSFRDLREAGLATLSGRRVTIGDWTALQGDAGFSPDYLHLDGMRADAA